MTAHIYPPAVRMTNPACDIREDGTVAILLDRDDYGHGHIVVDDTDTSLALAQAAMDAHEALAARRREQLAADLAQPRYVPEPELAEDLGQRYGRDAAGPMGQVAPTGGRSESATAVLAPAAGHPDVPRPGSGHPDPTQPGAGPGHQVPPGVNLAGAQHGGPGDGGEPAVVAAAAVLPAEAPQGDETCDALHEHWICTAVPGHDGGHVAHGAGGEVVHSWPQEATPASTDNGVTYDDAVAMLPDAERIHTFVNPAGMLVGADWDRDDVLALLRDGAPELAGEQATAMQHGLVAFRDGSGRRSEAVFIETRSTS